MLSGTSLIESTLIKGLLRWRHTSDFVMLRMQITAGRIEARLVSLTLIEMDTRATGTKLLRDRAECVPF